MRRLLCSQKCEPIAAIGEARDRTGVGDVGDRRDEDVEDAAMRRKIGEAGAHPD